LNTKPKATTLESTKCACKKLKVTNELEEFLKINTIEVFDKENKLMMVLPLLGETLY
jgi:hypothetical protein